MKKLLLALAFPLAGCATAPQNPPVQVTVSGPLFPSTTFDCGDEPLPPASPGGKAGSAAAHYENAERGWGRGCQRKLSSVGAQLRSAGQVIDPGTK